MSSALKLKVLGFGPGEAYPDVLDHPSTRTVAPSGQHLLVIDASVLPYVAFPCDFANAPGAPSIIDWSLASDWMNVVADLNEAWNTHIVDAVETWPMTKTVPSSTKDKSRQTTG